MRIGIHLSEAHCSLPKMHTAILHVWLRSKRQLCLKGCSKFEASANSSLLVSDVCWSSHRTTDPTLDSFYECHFSIGPLGLAVYYTYRIFQPSNFLSSTPPSLMIFHGSILHQISEASAPPLEVTFKKFGHESTKRISRVSSTTLSVDLPRFKTCGFGR